MSLGLLLGTVAGCGVISGQDLRDLRGKETESAETGSGSAGDKVSVSLQLSEEGPTSLFEPPAALARLMGDLDPRGFGLVASTGFIMDISGCASGYTASDVTGVASTKAITLYKTDRSCTAELQSFSFGGATYTKVGGGNLSGAIGTAAMFVNGSDANDKVKVRVHSLLPSPLTDGSTATFVFQQIKKGSDHVISNYTHSETLEVVGVESPNTTVQDVALTSIAVDGKATFLVTMQCATSMTQAGSDWICPSAGSDQHKIIHMNGKIITDATAGTLDYDAATTAMGSGTTAFINGDKVGGQERFTVSLAGQGALYTNKNMLLIISYVDPSSPTKGTSYKYFNVDIGDP